MGIYFICSHFNSFLFFIFAPPPRSFGPLPWWCLETQCEEGGGCTYNTHNAIGWNGGRKRFYFPLPTPGAKHLRRYRTSAIFIIIVIVEMVMVAATIIALATLDTPTLFLNPRKIDIQPPKPATHVQWIQPWPLHLPCPRPQHRPHPPPPLVSYVGSPPSLVFLMGRRLGMGTGKRVTNGRKEVERGEG